MLLPNNCQSKLSAKSNKEGFHIGNITGQCSAWKFKGYWQDGKESKTAPACRYCIDRYAANPKTKLREFGYTGENIRFRVSQVTF